MIFIKKKQMRHNEIAYQHAKYTLFVKEGWESKQVMPCKQIDD